MYSGTTMAVYCRVGAIMTQVQIASSTQRRNLECPVQCSDLPSPLVLLNPSTNINYRLACSIKGTSV